MRSADIEKLLFGAVGTGMGDKVTIDKRFWPKLFSFLNDLATALVIKSKGLNVHDGNVLRSTHWQE